MKTKKEIKQIRAIVIVFITLLALSGITAFPIRGELAFLEIHKGVFPLPFQNWIDFLFQSVQQTPDAILYGTDWLAFAHLIISIFFIGVYIDPVKNKFNVIVGIIACIAVFPLAFIMGPVRGIPFFHQLIDCSFGLLGLIPLTIIYLKIKKIEYENLNA